jgi:hypothetical protein
MPFSVVQFKHFVQSLITTSQVTIYTVPASSQDVLKNIDITNTSAASVTCGVNLVPTAGSAATGNLLFAAISIPANSTFHWTGTRVMNTGDFISVIAGTTNVLVISVDGLEST